MEIKKKKMWKENEFWLHAVNGDEIFWKNSPKFCPKCGFNTPLIEVRKRVFYCQLAQKKVTQSVGQSNNKIRNIL